MFRNSVLVLKAIIPADKHDFPLVGLSRPCRFTPPCGREHVLNPLFRYKRRCWVFSDKHMEIQLAFVQGAEQFHRDGDESGSDGAFPNSFHCSLFFGDLFQACHHHLPIRLGLSLGFC